jgi:hypothetical protein
LQKTGVIFTLLLLKCSSFFSLQRLPSRQAAARSCPGRNGSRTIGLKSSHRSVRRALHIIRYSIAKPRVIQHSKCMMTTAQPECCMTLGLALATLNRSLRLLEWNCNVCRCHLQRTGMCDRVAAALGDVQRLTWQNTRLCLSIGCHLGDSFGVTALH